MSCTRHCDQASVIKTKTTMNESNQKWVLLLKELPTTIGKAMMISTNFYNKCFTHVITLLCEIFNSLGTAQIYSQLNRKYTTPSCSIICNSGVFGLKKEHFVHWTVFKDNLKIMWRSVLVIEL